MAINISKIENLEKALPNLSRLNLRSNQISKIENLDHLPNLSQLDLGNNQISKIENLRSSLLISVSLN
jgi:Leucine-rich repeat (LRR) protein